MQGGLQAARNKYVKEQTAKGVSRDVALKRFYVQTRVAELQKAGKPVTAEVRARLRSNWDSGKVKRAEFGAPKAASKPKKPTVQGPKRTGPETKSTYKKPDRMGPESKSWTRKKPDRMGPETSSFTKPALTPKDMPGGTGGRMGRGKPVRTGPETTSYTKSSKADRMGPESKSYTKPKPSRTGPETTSYTKKKTPARKPSAGNMPGGPVGVKKPDRMGPETTAWAKKKKDWNDRLVDRLNRMGPGR